MTEILLKMGILATSGILDALGGWHILWMRRYLMPFVIGCAVSWFSHIWWLGGVCLPAMGTLCLGYAKGGNSGRGLWLFIQAVTLCLGCVILGHLTWWIALPYVVGAGVLGGIYKNWFQIVGDLITGAYLASFILFIH